jgi:hypothetical protein
VLPGEGVVFLGCWEKGLVLTSTPIGVKHVLGIGRKMFNAFLKCNPFLLTENNGVFYG